MDNVHFNGLFYNTMPNASSSTLPQCVKSDPNLFKDDVDIRFSKTFNTCKVYACRRGYPYNFLQFLSFLFLCRSLKFDMLRLKGYFKGWQTCVSSTLTSSTLFCWHIAFSLTALPSLRLLRRYFSSQSLPIREIVRAMGMYLTFLQ